MRTHLIDGQFKSDKYDWSPPGFVPLKLTDPMAWEPLWRYAQTRRSVDAEFADDLEAALKLAGYVPPTALMTGEQRELIAEHGPYTLREDGVLIDGNGFSLAWSMRPNEAAEECDWDRAVVAALNEVHGAEQPSEESDRHERKAQDDCA
jgi:hypothetical protein